MLGAAKHSELSCLHNKVFDLTSFTVTSERAGRSREVQGGAGLDEICAEGVPGGWL